VKRHHQPIFHYYASMVRRPCETKEDKVEIERMIFRNWPQPVLLKQIEEGPLNVRVWNPKVPKTQLEIVAISFLTTLSQALPF